MQGLKELQVNIKIFYKKSTKDSTKCYILSRVKKNNEKVLKCNAKNNAGIRNETKYLWRFRN